jgi:hypothetical protein
LDADHKMDANQTQHLVRLAVRIYGLISERFPAQTEGLLDVLDKVKKASKKKRDDRRALLSQELPPVILILTLNYLEGHEEFSAGQIHPLLGYLVSVFSLEYKERYADQQDPLKEMLGRIDWYLDGDKGSVQELLAFFLGEELDIKSDDLVAPLTEYLREVLVPELSKRIDLSFLYEKHFANLPG